jgi:hypothetical protein
MYDHVCCWSIQIGWLAKGPLREVIVTVVMIVVTVGFILLAVFAKKLAGKRPTDHTAKYLRIMFVVFAVLSAITTAGVWAYLGFPGG